MRLILDDFIVYKNVVVDFDDGVTLIVGDNGVGKSTLVEAIVWCLFGRILRAGGEKLTGSVQLEFTDSKGRKIVVKRTRKKSEAGSLFVDGEDVSMRTMRDTQSLIEELVGGWNRFIHTHIYTADGETFSTMTDAERKEVLKELLNLRFIDVARKYVYDDYNKAVAEVNLRNTTISLREKEIAELTQKKERIESLLKDTTRKAKVIGKELDAIRERKDKLTEKRADVVSRLEEIRGDLELLYEKLSNVEGELKVKEKELVAIETEISSKKQRLSEIERNVSLLQGKSKCPVCNQPIPEGKSPAELWKMEISELKSSIEALEGKRAEVLNEVVGLKGRVDTLNKLRQELRIEESRLIAEQNRLNVEISELEQTFSEKEKEASQIDSQVISLKAQVEAIDNTIQERQNEIKTLKAELKELDENVTITKTLYEMFGPTGLPNWMMTTFVSNLELATNLYLSMIGGIEVKILPVEKTKSGLRDKISIVPNVGGGKVSMVSGGEKRRIDTALLLGLRQLVGCSMRLPLIFDEVFDRLDEEGAEAVAQLISTYSTDNGIPTIVISHNREVAGLFPNARVYEVVKDKGLAKIIT